MYGPDTRGCLPILIIGTVLAWVGVLAISYGIYYLWTHIDISWIS